MMHCTWAPQLSPVRSYAGTKALPQSSSVDLAKAGFPRQPAPECPDVLRRAIRRTVLSAVSGLVNPRVSLIPNSGPKLMGPAPLALDARGILLLVRRRLPSIVAPKRPRRLDRGVLASRSKDSHQTVETNHHTPAGAEQHQQFNRRQLRRQHAPPRRSLLGIIMLIIEILAGQNR